MNESAGTALNTAAAPLTLALPLAGCDFDQGYLFARPLPENEFDAMLMRSQAS